MQLALKTPQAKTALVYLHGFLSSPQALKASIVEQAITDVSIPIDYYRPLIADKPCHAMPALYQYFESLNAAYSQVIIIGSSLGGFYAHVLSEHFGFTAVLINPLVDATKRISHYHGDNVGILENPYTGHTFSIDDEDQRLVSSLELVHQAFEPQNKLILLQMADEVLDARLAARYYQQSCCMIEAGGNHQFEHFERFTQPMFTWLGL